MVAGPPLIGSGVDLSLLTSSEDGEKDFRVKKILVAARIAGLNPPIVKQKNAALLKEAPLSRGLALKITIPTLPKAVYITQSNSALRTLADMAPGSGLYGMTEHERAEVDQWLEFSWHELEVALEVLKMAGDNGKVRAEAKKMAVKALSTFEVAVVGSTYLVGQRMTIADIALACAAEACLSGTTILSGRDLSELPHLLRWFRTVTCHPSFSAKAAAAGPKGKGAQASKAAVTNGKTDGPEPTGSIDCKYRTDADVHVPETIPHPPTKFKRNRTRVKELFARGKAAVGQNVVVRGWLRTMRSGGAGSLLFLVISDGSCSGTLQVVANRGTTAGFAAAVASGGAGSCLAIQGLLVESPAKGQAVELQALCIEVLGGVYNSEGKVDASEYPLAKKKHSLEYLRSIAHLRARTRFHSAVMRIRHAMAYATHKFFNDRGFLYVHTPILTAADCEGAGEQFQVSTLMPEEEHKPELPLLKETGTVDYSKDFFGRRSCLTVSGQLNVETHCCALSDVYTFGPTFRAENSHTSRHLAEFWMIEPEIAFANLEDDINLAEDYLKALVGYALANCDDDLQYFEAKDCPSSEPDLRDRLRNVLHNDFVRLTYTAAIELLLDHIKKGNVKFENEVTWGIDLASEHERYITEKVYKKPVVIIDYPKDIKAFYMKLNEDGKTVAAMDVLVPKIGELMGGSQREEKLDVLTSRAEAMGLSPESISWYGDLRRFGTMKHAGFGLGFERLVMFMTGVENIRDVIPFPRYPGHCEY